MGLWTRKSITVLQREAAEEGEGGLRRTLTASNLTLLGIGAIIGAGIFVLTGNAAAQYAGPGVVLSMVAAGLACGFAGLCYAEFASTFHAALANAPFAVDAANNFSRTRAILNVPAVLPTLLMTIILVIGI